MDTGSGLTIIPTAAFQMLKLSSIRKTRLTGIVAAAGQYPVATVEQIFVGPVSAPDVVIVGYDLPSDLRVEGVLGNSFLQHFTITADYRNALLLIEE